MTPPITNLCNDQLRDYVESLRVCNIGDGYLKSPGDDTPHKSDSYIREVSVGDKSTLLFTFQHEWELVPGDWVLQEWYGENKLAEVKFTVEKPST